MDSPPVRAGLLVAVMCVETLQYMLLTLMATEPMAETAVRETRNKSNANSGRFWPSCSTHKLFRNFVILLLLQRGSLSNYCRSRENQSGHQGRATFTEQ